MTHHSRRAFIAALLFAISGAALADKYGIDEAMSDRSGTGGEGILLILKWVLIGAGVSAAAAWVHNRTRDGEQIGIGDSLLLGGFLGLFLSLPLHALFD